MTMIAQTASADKSRLGWLRNRAVTTAVAASLWPLAGMWLLEASQAGMMASVVIFLVLPSIVLALDRPGIVPSALVFSVVVGGVSICWIDDLAARNGQWLVVDPVPARLPLVDASAQSIFWAVAHFFISVLAWERIMGRTARRGPNVRRVIVASGAALAVLAVFLAVRSMVPAWTAVPYFYLYFGTGLILAPVVVTFIRHPQLLRPLILLGILGFYWKACYEVAALRNDWWRFPGEFIGWVEVGRYRIPAEELVFWILLFSPAIAVFWEFWTGPRETDVTRAAVPGTTVT